MSSEANSIGLEVKRRDRLLFMSIPLWTHDRGLMASKEHHKEPGQDDHEA